jgi:hypothetical protein
MERKRKNVEIEAARADVQYELLSAAYRSLPTARAKVDYLHHDLGMRQIDICALTNQAPSTVNRWLKKPQTKSRTGRPNYLAPEDEQTLFRELIPKRYAEHTPMTTAQIVEEVRI